MKKARITKIVVLTISLLLLIGSAIGIGASAQDGDLSVSIIKKNISHNAEIKVLFAVDDTNVGLGGEVELLYAFEDPFTYADPLNDLEYFTAVEYAEGYTEGGHTYPAFVTAGFPASEIGDCVYAMAHIVGTDVYSEVMRYSVLEFANERLYDDGEISEDQELLYTSLLNYAAMAQKLLLNGNDDPSDDIANDELLTKYVRVSIEGGKLDDTPAVATDSSFTSGMYLVGDKVTVIGSGDYEVKVYDGEGNVTKSDVSAGAEITVSGRTNIAPKSIGAGDYFDELGGLTYDTDMATLINKGQVVRANYYFSKDHNSSTYTGNHGTVAVIDDGTGSNKVLEYYYKTNTMAPLNFGTNYAGASNSYDCFVFETDIVLKSIDQTSAAEIAGQSTPYIFWFEMSMFTGNNSPDTDPYPDANCPDLGCIAVVSDGEGGYDYYLATDYGRQSISETSKFNDGVNTVTFEVYGSKNKIKMFLNGNFVAETNLSSATGFDFSSASCAKVNFRTAQKNTIIYFDNTFVGKINKTYKAEQ